MNNMLSHNRKKEGYLPLLASSPPLGRVPTNPRRSSNSPGVTSRPGQAQFRTTHVQPQSLSTGRQRDKWVPLPDEENEQAPASQATTSTPAVSAAAPTGLMLVPTLFEDLPPSMHESSQRGRITLYCTTESFDRKKLDEALRSAYSNCTVLSYPDAFYLEYVPASNDQTGGDVFFLDYGVIVCWGLTKQQETSIARTVGKQCQIQPLPAEDYEVDEFQFNYSALEKPHIQNDMVTLHRRLASDHKIKLAISYALSQSTKLSVYEKRVMDMVLETKNLPEALAETGQVHISRNDIAKLIGKVFLQKSAVNLLSSVLDTPEFFWRAPDSFQALYERICEYLELETRVEVLNSRFQVLQEMLDMLRDHENNHHNARLEWIVIWLIVVEVIVGLFELLGLFGFVGREH